MSWTIYCLSEAMSPISQMQGVVGNQAIISRQDVMTRLGKRAVPVLTGNAIRHQLREHGARWLIETMGESGKLTQPEVYYLIGGGSGFVGRGGRESPASTLAMRELSPHLSVLGGTTPQDIVGGRLRADFALLVCEENWPRMKHFMPPDILTDDLQFRPAASFIGSQQYTRNASTDSVGDLFDADTDLSVRSQMHAEFEGKGKPEKPGEMWIPGEDKDKSPQMIYAGECVNPGALFVHRLRIGHDSRLELGAILWALRLWQANGGIIGGMAAKGHGILKTSVLVDPAIEGDPVADYIDHAITNGPKLAAWIKEQFRPAPKSVQVEGESAPKKRKAKAS